MLVFQVIHVAAGVARVTEGVGGVLLSIVPALGDGSSFGVLVLFHMPALQIWVGNGLGHAVVLCGGGVLAPERAEPIGVIV